MTPEDPRHGTYAGVIAHQKDREALCDPCATARTRTQKRQKLLRHRGIALSITHAQLQATLSPWLRMGVSPTAIYRAAGLSETYGGTAYSTGRGALASTRDALAAVTEDDFRGTDMVYADLTRRRIFSLRAIGHRLTDMPVDGKGVWRTHERVTIATARAMRDHYRTLEFTIGPNKNGMARARNEGHRPPLSWDDPGTLAWPNGPVDWQIPRERHLDFVVVQRLLDGERIRSTKAEKVEAMRRWLAAGKSERSLCQIHGWHEGRYVIRGNEEGAA